MEKRGLSFPFLVTLLLIGVLLFSSWILPGTIIVLQQATQTPTPASDPTEIEDSWIIVDLPEDSTQLEYGAEVYRLVCKACHGDKGQGLTDEWRAQWAPGDQNCWQSKCHALNHPPDGFYMPQAPKVLGQPIRGFGTALNLYNYNHDYMPWHDRGSMTEEDSWSVTAYLLKINGIDPGPNLNAETAANIDLSVIDPNLGPTSIPISSQSALSPEPQPTPTPDVTPTLPVQTPENVNQAVDNNGPPWTVGFVLLMVVIVFVIILLRRRPGEPSKE